MRKRVQFNGCQFTEYLNHSLLIDALIVAGVKGISRRNTHNVLKSFCPMLGKESDTDERTKGTGRQLFKDQNVVITDHKCDCIFRNCKLCGSVRFQNSIQLWNEGTDWNKTATWHQWEYVHKDDTKSKKNERKYFDKVRYTGFVAQLLALFMRSLHNYSIHLFTFDGKPCSLKNEKKQLNVGEVMMIIDFTQNWTHHRQDEIQGGYWSQKQSTLHPIVVYYPCQENCNNLVCEELMMISDDLKHDGYAVNAFIEKGLCHLRENKIPIKCIVIVPDNCAMQYKSFRVFDMLSKMKIPVIRNYFCAKHAKAEADGAIGHLSMHIDNVVHSGQYQIGNSLEMVCYCQLKLQLRPDSETEICFHYRRAYFHVTDINREGDTDSQTQTVKGTPCFHSVCNTGILGIIEVWESSCYCEPCFLNVPGEFKNHKLVNNFAWAFVYKKPDISGHVENKLWNGFSLP